MKVLQADYLVQNDYRIPDGLDLSRTSFQIVNDTLIVKLSPDCTIEIHPLQRNSQPHSLRHPKTWMTTQEDADYSFHTEDTNWEKVLYQLEHPKETTNFYNDAPLLWALNWGWDIVMGRHTKTTDAEWTFFCEQTVATDRNHMSRGFEKCWTIYQKLDEPRRALFWDLVKENDL